VETVMALCIGIGLSAACGFRVFVPMLAMSAAAKAGLLGLAPGFEWIGSWGAFAGFGVAAVLELVAYYVPWLDNLLDAAATPAAVIAGVLATASQVDTMNPLLQWTTALLAGGGAAGGVQLATVTARGASTATTAGIANPIIATVEHAAAVVLSVLAIVVPAAVGLALIAIVFFLIRRRVRSSRRMAMA
jgi:hypothetical protein